MLGNISIIAVLLGIAFWSLRQPVVAFTAVLCMFSFEQWAQFSIGYFLTNRTIINYLIGIIVLIAVLNRIFLKQKNYKLITVNTIFVLLLYIYSFATLIWTPDFALAFSIWRKAFPYLIVIVLMAPLLVNNSNDIKNFVGSLYIFGVPLAILLFFFVDWQYRSIVLKGYSYETSVLGNPLEIGTFAGILLITTVYNKFKYIGFLNIFARVLIAILCLALIVESGSRGQLLAAVFSIFIFWPFRFKHKKFSSSINTLFVLIGLLATIAIAVVYIGGENYRWTTDRIEFDILARLDANLKLLAIWVTQIQAVVIGLGNSASYTILGIYPHNIPVEILTEEGLIGFLIYSLLLVHTIRYIKLGLILTKKSPDKRSDVLYLSSLLIFVLILSLKQGNLLGSTYFFMFVIVISRYVEVLKFEVMKKYESNYK